jgi:hypothetical protein
MSKIEEHKMPKDVQESSRFDAKDIQDLPSAEFVVDGSTMEGGGQVKSARND